MICEIHIDLLFISIASPKSFSLAPEVTIIHDSLQKVTKDELHLIDTETERIAWKISFCHRQQGAKAKMLNGDKIGKWQATKQWNTKQLAICIFSKNYLIRRGL